jgi:hypothetical protein
LKNYRINPHASANNEGIKWLESAVKGPSAIVQTKDSARTPVDDGPTHYSHTVAAKSSPCSRTNAMWSMSRVVSRRDSTVCVDACAEDAQQVYCEDKLGCARGVIWAAAFQISVVLAVAICWELYSLLR